MKRAILMVAALALLIGGVGQAKADYTFTYSDGTNVGSGTLVTMPIVSPPAPGALWASSGTLVLTSGVDAGSYTLVSGGPGVFGIPGFIVDNVLYPLDNAGSSSQAAGTVNPSYLDEYGLGFTNGSEYINLWGNGPGPGNYTLYSLTYGDLSNSGTFALTAVPEPSGIALLGLGVVCLAAGYVVRKRILALTAA